MEALAFLLFAAGCLIALHTFDVVRQRRIQSARCHARPMTRREFRDTYYASLRQDW